MLCKSAASAKGHYIVMVDYWAKQLGVGHSGQLPLLLPPPAPPMSTTNQVHVL